MSQPPSSQPPPPPGAPRYRSSGLDDPRDHASTPPLDPAGGRPGAPPTNRLLWLVGVLAVLLIAVVVNYLLHSGGDVLNPVAEAAERTAKMPGADLAMEVTYTAEGSSTPIVGTGSGVYDARTGRTKIEMTVPIPGREPVSMEAVGDDRTEFLRSPTFAGELPPGVEWLGMEPFLGRNPETAFGSNGSAKGTLEVLRAVGGVERLDQQTVRGHLTTRYKGTIELSKAAQLLGEKGEAALAREYEQIAERAPGSIPVEVWIDGRGLARQVRMVQQLPTATGGSMTMDMRMQYFDFGAHPRIKFPPKRRVLDYTPVLRAELGMDEGQSLGPLRPPAGATPLSPSAFRRRATGICHKVVGEAKVLFKRNVGLLDAIKGLGSDTDSLEANQARTVAIAYGRRFEEPAYRLLRRGTRELAALDPPTRYADDYRHYLQLDAMQMEWALAQARALQIGAFKLPGLESHKPEAEQEARERKSLASKLGISSCEQSSQSGDAQATT